jgi:hypothetical protein
MTLDLPTWLIQPPWWLQLILYAVFTSLFTGIIAPIVLEKYKETKKRKAAELTQKVEEAKANVERLRTEISTMNDHLVRVVDDDLERVKTIQFFDPPRESTVLNIVREWPDIAVVAERYVEAINEAAEWRDVNRERYKYVIGDIVGRDFHKTTAANPHPTPSGWAGRSTLENALQILLIDPIVKGDKISRDFIEQLNPQLCIQIRQLSAEGEGIERFLQDLNNTIATDQFLRRFQRKRIAIMDLGNELKKAAQKHASELQVELEKWQGMLLSQSKHLH